MVAAGAESTLGGVPAAPALEGANEEPVVSKFLAELSNKGPETTVIALNWRASLSAMML